MKKVLLLGDSIRMGVATDTDPNGYLCGYETYVKEALAGRAEVFGPDDNVRFTVHTLRQLHDWAKALNAGADVDVVHWNNGLWDTLRINGDEPLVPIEIYRAYLPRVLNRIRELFPNAKVIFALTTPSVEEKASPEFKRYNADINAYNAVAREVLEPLGVTINDLNTPAKEIQKAYALDAVHYTPAGAKMLSAYVANAIEKALAE